MDRAIARSPAMVTIKKSRWKRFLNQLSLQSMILPGVLNKLLTSTGLIQEPIFFMGNPAYFWFIAVFTGIAKSFGFGAILYLAAMAGVDPQLHEAAVVDGAVLYSQDAKGYIRQEVIFAVS